MIKYVHDLPTFVGKNGIRIMCNFEKKNSDRDSVKLRFIFYFIDILILMQVTDYDN